MDKPKRIQRKRTKGWKMSEGAVYVGRPTIWGNPFVADTRCQICHLLIQGAAGSVEAFGRHIKDGMLFGLLPDDISSTEEWLEPLKGKDLACWCKLSDPCHANVLLKLANKGKGAAII